MSDKIQTSPSNKKYREGYDQIKWKSRCPNCDSSNAWVINGKCPRCNETKQVEPNFIVNVS